MKRCMEGEAWFCNPQDILDALLTLAQGAIVSSSNGCLTLEHPRLAARICPGSTGRVGAIEYRTCMIQVHAEPGLCPKVKIILMRGGG